MIFRDRKDAGARLAEALEKYKEEDAVLLALPRGGVVLGAEIAKRLDLKLDLIIAKKIGHPTNPEYAICAIAEDGPPVCNLAEVKNIDARWLAEEIILARNEIKRRRQKYLGEIRPYSVKGKTVIIVDDGVATGITMLAAIDELKQHSPKRIVVAIPVTPFDTAQKLKEIADDLVSLFIDETYLGAVGAYYEDFRQVEDSEVISLLKSVGRKEGF